MKLKCNCCDVMGELRVKVEICHLHYHASDLFLFRSFFQPSLFPFLNFQFFITLVYVVFCNPVYGLILLDMHFIIANIIVMKSVIQILIVIWTVMHNHPAPFVIRHIGSYALHAASDDIYWRHFTP